jgi:hypothetical protein
MSGDPATPSAATIRVMASAVLRRPGLWGPAVAAIRRLAAPGWWRRSPYLPLPDGRLWAFRMVTAYGRPDAAPDPADVVSYLRWTRSFSRPAAIHGARGIGRRHGNPPSEPRPE